MEYGFVSYSKMILEKSSLYEEMHEVDHHKKCSLRVTSDGASWSAIVDKGEPVDAAGSGATTSVIGATTSGAG
nr:hypothetical protein [Tanacetum cinerariifolium]